MEKNTGARGQGRPKKGGRAERPPKDETPKLSDLGISKTQSSRWQQLAGLPDQEFEDKVTRATDTAVAAIDAPPRNKPPKKRKPRTDSNPPTDAEASAEARKAEHAALAGAGGELDEQPARGEVSNTGPVKKGSYPVAENAAIGLLDQLARIADDYEVKLDHIDLICGTMVSSSFARTTTPTRLPARL
jgi:hypothetical protein